MLQVRARHDDACAMETTATRPARTSRWRRTATLAAGTLGVALLLSGCVKLDMALTLTPDNTVDGAIVFAVDKQLLTLAGGKPEDAFKDAASDAPFPTAPEGGSVRTEVYDQDGKYGQKYIFSGVPITSFQDEDLSIKREGDFFVVDGTLDLSSTTGGSTTSGDSPFPLPSALTGGFDVQISMTFPGEVVEHNGTLDGTTVTWKPTAGQKLALKAKAKATPTNAGFLGLSSVSSSTGLLIGLVLAGLILFGAVIALILRGRRTPAHAGPPTADLGVPGTAYAPAPDAGTAAATAAPAEGGVVPGFAPDVPAAPPVDPGSGVPGTSAPDAAWAPPPAPLAAPAPPAGVESPASPVHDTLVVPEEAATQVVPAPGSAVEGGTSAPEGDADGEPPAPAPGVVPPA